MCTIATELTKVPILKINHTGAIDSVRAICEAYAADKSRTRNHRVVVALNRRTAAE
jgi:hypothetical protein